uniref:Uncharacterized protein n=1 Tax=Chromera velia CCMP2878 TaxID=1169474 RepID=A0A0G4IB65_9ALVE|eukprot:Cvel_12667.t1-p1 / transcript=Cvel_12667.t1 / gene=Cvel_12667 / organism=Chromera_velia_CCMP2878 / gene_product=hypothetical protein / transcript_product=hypothetical protein / location=Cvel_scaffold837:38095-38841(-) / protein_length=249 / sequence_SO=supercontig / SO=protein_coding / is_pseudo=false
MRETILSCGLILFLLPIASLPRGAASIVERRGQALLASNETAATVSQAPSFLQQKGGEYTQAVCRGKVRCKDSYDKFWRNAKSKCDPVYFWHTAYTVSQAETRAKDDCASKTCSGIREEVYETSLRCAVVEIHGSLAKARSAADSSYQFKLDQDRRDKEWKEQRKQERARKREAGRQMQSDTEAEKQACFDYYDAYEKYKGFFQSFRKEPTDPMWTYRGRYATMDKRQWRKKPCVDASKWFAEWKRAGQ